MYIRQNMEVLAVICRSLTLCQLFVVCYCSCWYAHVVKLFPKTYPTSLCNLTTKGRYQEKSPWPGESAEAAKHKAIMSIGLQAKLFSVKLFRACWVQSDRQFLSLPKKCPHIVLHHNQTQTVILELDLCLKISLLPMFSNIFNLHKLSRPQREDAM